MLNSNNYYLFNYRTVLFFKFPDFIAVQDAVTASGTETPPGAKKGRRGRKPARVDVKLKLERSRQSARECRARKKLRYQYLEELVAGRERAIYQLRSELETVSANVILLDIAKIYVYVGLYETEDPTEKCGSLAEITTCVIPKIKITYTIIIGAQLSYVWQVLSYNRAFYKHSICVLKNIFRTLNEN